MGKISQGELKVELAQKINDAAAHSEDQTNPHGVTAEQTGAYHPGAKNAVKKDLSKYEVHRSGKDSKGIFTVLEYRTQEGNLVMKSTLSGGTSPKYTTRTEAWYKSDGITVDETVIFTISYDVDGDVVSEVF